MSHEKDFFCQNPVNVCSETKLETNHILRSFIRNAGYKTITDFAFDLGVSRSRVSQIVNNIIPADEPMKIKISQLLKVDSRIVFPEVKK